MYYCVVGLHNVRKGYVIIVFNNSTAIIGLEKNENDNFCGVQTYNMHQNHCYHSKN